MTGKNKGVSELCSDAPKKVMQEQIISIHVFAGAKKEKLIKLNNDKYEVFVKEPAQNNLANKRVIKIFSELCKNAQVKIITGHKSPKKKLQISFDL